MPRLWRRLHGDNLRHISLLGSTGSIGRQTLDIVAAHPGELKVVALAAGGKNLALLAEQVIAHSPELVAVPSDSHAKQLHELLGKKAAATEIITGDLGLEEVASHPGGQTVVTGVVGFLGLKPTAAALRKGKTIALANKETLVAAGAAVMPMVKQYGSKIVPVDSEHSAIFQSLGAAGPRGPEPDLANCFRRTVQNLEPGGNSACHHR